MVPAVTLAVHVGRRRTAGSWRRNHACCPLFFSLLPHKAAPGRLPEWPKGAVCKTVGSAYVGSNPTPATTCKNAPLAANSRAGGAFFCGPVVGQLVSLWTVMLRCPRTHSGRASGPLGRSVCTVATVGVHRRRFHGRPRTGRAGGVSRLDARRRVERASLCAP